VRRAGRRGAAPAETEAIPETGATPEGAETEAAETEVAETEPAETEAAATEAPAAGEGTSVRLSGWTASPEEEDLLQGVIQECNQQNAGYQIKYEPIPADYWPKLKTMVGSGTEPDIYYMDIFQFPFFVEQDVLLPLDDYMESADISRDDFLDTLMEAFTFEGSVYGIPKDFNTLALFYNQDLLEQAAVEEPTDDWTWEDLEAASQAVTEATGKAGFSVPADPGRFPIFVFQNGGQIMTGDFTDTAIDRPEAIEAGQFYTGARTDGWAIIPTDIGVGWQGEAFGKGEAAMVLEGGWLVPYLTEQFPDLRYSAVQPPAGPAGEGNLVLTVAYVINSRSPNPQAAFDAITCLTSEEHQLQVLQSGFALPSRAALQDNEYLDENPVARTIFTGAEFATPFMWGGQGEAVNAAMQQALERVYLQDVSVEDSFSQAAEEIRSAVEQ
jgi:multiple sugar transport system substrate-binding protein